MRELSQTRDDSIVAHAFDSPAPAVGSLLQRVAKEYSIPSRLYAMHLFHPRIAPSTS